MAQVKYGSGITGLKGSLGGHVFQGGNGGAIVRQKMGKLMPKSDAFFNQNANFRAVSAAWNMLDQASKQAWNDVAHTWPHTNRFGDAINVSGYNVFIELNTIALLAGFTIRTAAYEHPSSEAYTFPVGTVNYSTHFINVGCSPWIGPYNYLLLFISDPIPAASALQPKKFYYAGKCQFDGTHQTNIYDIVKNSPHINLTSGFAFWIKPLVFAPTYNWWQSFNPFRIKDLM